MRGGRARWRIENDAFNTLKNQGYNFEHNFGHGNKNLCSVMGMLLMLAFLIDQLSELCDDTFQKAKAKAGTYRVLWNDMKFLFRYFVFSSWDNFLGSIANKRISNTS